MLIPTIIGDIDYVFTWFTNTSGCYFWMSRSSASSGGTNLDFNSWSSHFVENNSQIDQIHIVIDTLGSKGRSWLANLEFFFFRTTPYRSPIQKKISSLPIRFEKCGIPLSNILLRYLKSLRILSDYPNPSQIHPYLFRLERGWKETWAE